MTVAAKYPLTLAERLELGADPVRFPATWEEYLDLLEECEYPIEFENNEVIAMSIATDPHEAIVANILGILYNLFADQSDLRPLSSNRHVFIPEFEADYAPDVHVVKGPSEEHVLRKGLTANLNPYIIFEVLSPSTYDKDYGTKLPRYKKIPTVRQIIYVEQNFPMVSVSTRMGDSNRWESQDFDQMEQAFLVEGKPVAVKDLYQKVTLQPQPN